MPKPWDPDYKPPSAAEAFDPSAPLPESVVETLAYLDRKDGRIVELEACVITLCAALDRLGKSDMYVVQEARRVLKGNDLD